MKQFDVVAICNALVDILVEVKDTDLTALELNKGVMHLVDEQRQHFVLNRFSTHDKTIELGGSAMNAIRTLAALECRTVFAGAVGADEFGQRIRTRMHQLGIAAKLVENKQMATGSCVILVTADGERTMNTNLGASRLYDEDLVPHDEIADAKILHFCGYQWDTDEQKEAIRSAIKTAKAHDTLISFDLADPFVVDRHRDELIQIIENDADIVFSNREEARLLYRTDPEDAAARIAATKAVAVVKLGADGAMVRRGDEIVRIKPVATHVVDTTAAGDMFAAGFLYGYLASAPLQRCGDIAAHLASDVISRMGATVSDSALAIAGEML